MNSKYQQADRSVSAVFKEHDDLDRAVRQLIDKGVPKDNISMMGRNFKSESRIKGFITRKDLIVDGLKEGAIFGSIFGSFLGLLTQVGMLFVPFVGPVVAAGPLGAAVLGAASGALAGSAGAGIGSALLSLGLPKDKAAVYETRMQAGEFLIVVEVPAETTEEVTQMLESAGAEEIHTSEMKIPRQPSGELESKEHLSPELKADMSEHAQDAFVKEYNNSLKEESEHKAAVKAWQKIESEYDRDDRGVLSQPKAS